jgi:hypothetical protein
VKVEPPKFLGFDSYDVEKVALMQPNSPQRNNTNRGKMIEVGERCIILGIERYFSVMVKRTSLSSSVIFLFYPFSSNF